MSARLTLTLSHTSVWLLFLACLMTYPAHAGRYDRGGEEGTFRWRDILRDAVRDEVREYRAPRYQSSDETGTYRRDEPRDRYDGWREQRAARRAEGERRAAMERQRREEAAARAQQEREAERARREEEQRRQEAQRQEQQRAAELAQLERERQQAQASQNRDEVDTRYVTAFSPWRAVANSASVFFHPEKFGYGDPLVYRGEPKEMVVATVHRQYRRPGFSETLYEIDFDSPQGKHVWGWVYSKRVSPSFSDLARPWPAEFVVSGSIRPQPSDSANDGDALYYGVRLGTQVEAIGYASTERGTWYLVRRPNSDQIYGWVQAGQIQDVGTLARIAEQRSAAQRRETMERQQIEAMLRALPSQAFALYLVSGVLLALIPRYRNACEEQVNAAGGIGAFMRGRIFWFLAFSGFVAMVFYGIGSAEAGILALVLLAAGIRAGVYVPWLVFAVFAYLHYLFVPHPMESPIDKAMAEHDPSKVRLGDVTDAMFDYERDDLPTEWQSENYARRLDALEKRLRGEKAVADGLSDYLRKKSQDQVR